MGGLAPPRPGLRRLEFEQAPAPRSTELDKCTGEREFGAGHARFPGDSPVQGTSFSTTIVELISEPLKAPRPVMTAVVVDELSKEEFKVLAEYIGDFHYSK